MRRWIVALAVLALAAATATGVRAASQLIYRVDGVTAKIVHGRLVVTARGAVASGGWTRPRLHLIPHVPEAPDAVIEFQASPPLGNAVVIQALLPITTTAVYPLPHYGTVRLKVMSETNAVTAPIQ